MAYKYTPYKKERWDFPKILAILIIGTLAIYMLLPVLQNFGPRDSVEGPPGYEEIALIGVTDRSMVLGDRCNNLEIPITQDQLFSIRAALSGGYVRPLTHDIYKSTIDHFGIEPVYFTLDRYDGDLWYATLRLRKETEILDMEVRPSDGVGISVRYDLPIFIESNTYEEQAKQVC
jgi:bifunctional DNase/RNase